MAGFQSPSPAWEGALAFHPDQTQPSLGIFFFLPTVTRFIGVASEVGFYSFFFSPAPSPLLLGTPGLFPFLDRALKLWNSLLRLTPAFLTVWRVRDELWKAGIHPLTAN